MDTHNFFNRPLVQFLSILVLALSAIALAAFSYKMVEEARYAHGSPATISVSGTGEVDAVPDLGTFSFAVVAEAETADAAQADAARRSNDILEYLEEAGVAEADIRTQRYDLSPRYEYPREVCPPGMACPPGERVLVGYEVRQGVEVRVRDTEQAGVLIAGVGERGATNISQLRFTIDDDQSLHAEARAAAIADAEEQARTLARALGVRIVRIVSFTEDGQPWYPAPYARMEMAMDSATAVPELPVGEETIARQVTITYEVR